MAVFYNQATLSYNDTTINSNIVSGEIVEVLSASKTAVQSSYSREDPVTYVINIVNSGATPITGLSISDNLGEYTFNEEQLTPLEYEEGSVKYFADGVLQATPDVTAGPPLIISGITVPANGIATVIYQARLNEFAPLAADSEITNEAVISGASITTPVTVTETITVDNSVNLDITKSVSPSTVVENGQITYTFVISNNGNTDAIATDNVTVSDTFNPILSDIAVEFNGASWAEGTNYTYNETTGNFVTIPGQITVPAATFIQNETTGEITVIPGTATITVTGTV